jgi:putative ubiquitin-RnfH superfamily antitoxin RatB of RatAB toxin-antitoxin module
MLSWRVPVQSMPAVDLLRVRVVYALPHRQIVVDVTLEQGATVGEAVAKSQLQQRYPQTASEPLTCAVFGRIVALSDSLRDGDRVEILRPLLVDPKEQRRQLAARTRKNS